MLKDFSPTEEKSHRKRKKGRRADSPGTIGFSPSLLMDIGK